MVFEKHINEIEKLIAYSFKDKSLLKQAFTRTSYCNEHSNGKHKYQSNEVLEFFGDSVLSCAIITLLMKEHTERYAFGIKAKLAEGDFSNIKSRLSDKKNLSKSTLSLGLQKYLIMGEGDAKLGIENEPSVMEDLFESIVGAIYIDCAGDFSCVLKSVSKMLDVSLYLGAKEAPMQSFKNAIQEWCADKRHRMPTPIYKTVSETGPDHKKTFERACYIGDKIYGTGTGKNQKVADANAAEAALSALKAEYEKTAKPYADPEEIMQKLRACAKKNKKPSPEFKDLGESENSVITKKEFAVECRFMGKTSTGMGVNKKEAKADAAKKMLDLMTPKKAPIKKAPAKTRQNQKRKFKPKQKQNNDPDF